MADDDRRTYLLVDGENIDAILGSGILNQRPAPEDRSRWDRVRGFVGQEFGQPVKRSSSSTPARARSRCRSSRP